MSTKHGILHLLDPAEVRAADEVTAMARGLSPDHYEVTIAGPLPAHFCRRLAYHQVRWVNVPLPPAGSLSGCIRAARQVRRLLKSKPVDLIHAHSLSAAFTALLARRGGQGKPAVLWSLHGACTPRTQGTVTSWWHRRLLRWVLGNCTALVVHSQAERDLLQAVSPQAAQTAQVVYPAVSSARPWGLYDVGVKRRQLGLHPDAAIVGVLGLPTADEVAGAFLRAAVRVSTDLPNVEFTIIGTDRQDSGLRELVHNLGIGGACTFLDIRRDIGEGVLVLNVLVLLSDAGGALTYGLQALAADIPVIAADTEALVEILGDLPQVRVVAPRNVEAMTAAMMDLLEILPADESHVEVVSANGTRLRPRDVLVSQQSYDLQEKWTNSGSRGGTQPSAAEMLLSRYGIRRLVTEMEKIYYQALQ